MLLTWPLVALLTVSCSETGSEKPEISEATSVLYIDQDKDVKIEANSMEPYGMYLTDSKGRALYLFTADSKKQSKCYDACAKAWPPVILEGNLSAGKQVNISMLSTMERKDGKKQVAYNGMPLYYYIKDQSKGQVTGQDIKSFGGEWYLVSPQGTKIEAHKEKQPK